MSAYANSYHEVVLTDAAADETASTALGPAKLDKLKNHTFYADWGTGVTAGVITVETASHAEYTGTWSPIPSGTITFAGTAPNAGHLSFVGAYLALRARISTAVANGTVTVTYFGN